MLPWRELARQFPESTHADVEAYSQLFDAIDDAPSARSKGLFPLPCPPNCGRRCGRWSAGSKWSHGVCGRTRKVRPEAVDPADRKANRAPAAPAGRRCNWCELL